MGFDVFPHNLYNIKNRQWWLTTGTAAMMNNVTTSTHKCCSYASQTPCTMLELPQNTQSKEHTVQAPLNTTATEPLKKQ